MRSRFLLGWGSTVALFVLLPIVTLAQSADDIQAQIDSQNQQIDQLNKEIAQYQTQLDATTAKKQTLQNTLDQLNLSIKKVTASVNLTKAQIDSTQLQIDELANGIDDKQAAIDGDHAGLAESIRRLNETESNPLATELLMSGSVSSAWEDIDNFQTLQGAVRGHIVNLTQEKQQLTDVKAQREAKEQQLQSQKADLVTQQGSLNATKKAQSDLLTQTKSQESTYQKIIAEKKAQEKSFEDALTDLKSQLNVAVNQSQIPTASQGVLHWPIAGKIVITQYFGDTPFAQTHASLYSGHGHDGLDIAAPIGTPVYAALSGTVLATGNTDSIKGCYSFGKWIMLKHANGLNTMYAHLSEIDVTSGANVTTGQIIGYSGETGYATGPHLHFGVYVSSVTQIIKLGDATKSITPCASAVMPVPPLAGYLNPLNYL